MTYVENNPAWLKLPPVYIITASLFGASGGLGQTIFNLFTYLVRGNILLALTIWGMD